MATTLDPVADLGVVLTLRITPLDILLGALDKGTNPLSGARQMPFRFTSVKRRTPTPSTSITTSLQLPVASVGDCAADYGTPGERCDGMSVRETYAAVQRAIERARAGDGPSLVEALVYRLGPHTSHDDDCRYRVREEVASWEAREPIARLHEELLEFGLLDHEEAALLQSEVRDEIEAAVRLAETAPEPDPPSASREVLGDVIVPNPFERAARPSTEARQSSEGIQSTGASA